MQPLMKSSQLGTPLNSPLNRQAIIRATKLQPSPVLARDGSRVTCRHVSSYKVTSTLHSTSNRHIVANASQHQDTYLIVLISTCQHERKRKLKEKKKVRVSAPFGILFLSPLDHRRICIKKKREEVVPVIQ